MSYFQTSSRILDVDGKVPPGNFGVHTAKSLFREHIPYVATGDPEYNFTINFNYHYIKNLRRVLAGVTGNTQFSKEEQALYDDYVAWLSDDMVFTGERLVVLTELDKWMTDEIQELDHAQMTRSYSSENQWK